MKQKLNLKESLEQFERLAIGQQAQRGRVNLAPNAADMLDEIDISLSKTGSSLDSLMVGLEKYLSLSPDVSQARFFKLLYSGLNFPALLGEWVASLSNATMHTYQVSPVATLMELELIKQLNQLIGFNNGDGVMVSGGSQANLISMMLARERACPLSRQKGIGDEKLIAYVSDQAHYSYLKAANVLGIGSENLISVASDAQGRMCPSSLGKEIKVSLRKGHVPFYIGLTTGTTVIGAFDPIEPCVNIAKQEGVWCHLDACWGGPTLFSAEHKQLMVGCHLADSLAWDAHKLMNVPLTAGFILVKQAGLLAETCSGGGEDYLFHEDENTEFNLGLISIQCGRRADALKVWASWKFVGNQGFGEKIDFLQHIKARCVDLIEQSECFEMLAPAAFLNVLFKYRPNFKIDLQQSREINISICQQLKREGQSMVDFASYKGDTGIRLILANDQVHWSDIKFFLNNCQRMGDDLASQL